MYKIKYKDTRIFFQEDSKPLLHHQTWPKISSHTCMTMLMVKSIIMWTAFQTSFNDVQYV